MPDVRSPGSAELGSVVTEAYARLERRLRSGAPTLAERALGWTRSLSDGASPERYFTHPDAFPMLLVPWWLERAIRGVPDRRFQAELAYSTMSGYYCVRLIDDLMDGERPPAAEVLPALTVFHSEFIRTYQALFASDEPFWDELAATWMLSAEMASVDASRGAGTRAEFIETSARKVVAARIPLAAVCHRHGRTDLLEAWYRFVDLFGRWHQMLNDITGWQDDLQHGRRTYFLSKAPGGGPGAVGAWLANEGLAWALAELDTWSEEAAVAAAALDSPDLAAYLEERRSAGKARWEGVLQRMEALRSLSNALR